MEVKKGRGARLAMTCAALLSFRKWKSPLLSGAGSGARFAFRSKRGRAFFMVVNPSCCAWPAVMERRRDLARLRRGRALGVRRWMPRKTGCGMSRKMPRRTAPRRFHPPGFRAHGPLSRWCVKWHRRRQDPACRFVVPRFLRRPPARRAGRTWRISLMGRAPPVFARSSSRFPPIRTRFPSPPVCSGTCAMANFCALMPMPPWLRALGTSRRPSPCGCLCWKTRPSNSLSSHSPQPGWRHWAWVCSRRVFTRKSPWTNRWGRAGSSRQRGRDRLL